MVQQRFGKRGFPRVNVRENSCGKPFQFNHSRKINIVIIVLYPDERRLSIRPKIQKIFFKKPLKTFSRYAILITVQSEYTKNIAESIK